MMFFSESEIAGVVAFSSRRWEIRKTRRVQKKLLGGTQNMVIYGDMQGERTG